MDESDFHKIQEDEIQKWVYDVLDELDSIGGMICALGSAIEFEKRGKRADAGYLGVSAMSQITQSEHFRGLVKELEFRSKELIAKLYWTLGTDSLKEEKGGLLDESLSFNLSGAKDYAEQLIKKIKIGVIPPDLVTRKVAEEIWKLMGAVLTWDIVNFEGEVLEFSDDHKTAMVWNLTQRMKEYAEQWKEESMDLDCPPDFDIRMLAGEIWMAAKELRQEVDEVRHLRSKE